MERKNIDLASIGVWSVVTGAWTFFIVARTFMLFSKTYESLESFDLFMSYFFNVILAGMAIFFIYGGVQLIRMKKSGLATLKILLVFYIATVVLPRVIFFRRFITEQFIPLMVLSWIWFAVIPVFLAVYLFSRKVSKRF
jgi:hypothetical protein